MPKLLLTLLMLLLSGLAVALGEAADTSQSARVIIAAVFVVALSVPALLAVGLLWRRLGPHVINHYHYDNRQIILRSDAPTVTQPPRVEPPALAEPERGLTRR